MESDRNESKTPISVLSSCIRQALSFEELREVVCVRTEVFARLFAESAGVRAAELLAACIPEGRELPKQSRAKSETGKHEESSAKDRGENKKPQDLGLKAKETGTLHFPNGDCYQGDLHNDLPHGKGIMVYAGDHLTTYDGDWANGVMEGFGKLTFKNGKVYEGQWHAGKRHGQGTTTWNRKTLYEGSWQEDKEHGFGLQQTPEGESYRGNFIRGRYCGYGKKQWPDGRVYVGNWCHGEMLGSGLETEPDGGSYFGEWKRNKKHGNFIYTKGDISRTEHWSEGVRADH